MKKTRKKKFKWRGKGTEPKQTQNTNQHNAAVKVYKKEKTEQNKILVTRYILSGNITTAFCK